MYSFAVNAKRLNEILWNALLFTPKSGVTEGKVFFSLRLTEEVQDFTMFACDDFIVVQDSIVFVAAEANFPTESQQFVLPVAFVKELETETRKVAPEENIKISVAEGKFLCLDSDQEVEYPSEVWGTLVELSDGDWAPTEFALDFYLNPERLKQIPRMKIEGHLPKGKQDHPIGFRYALMGDAVMIPFIYGPSVKGVITSMNEVVLLERGVHTWGEDTRPALPNYEVGDTVTVAGIEFTKIADDPFEDGWIHPEDDVTPPWDDPDGYLIDLQGVQAKHWTPTRVEYDNPVDLSTVPDHVDEDEHQQFGF